MFFIISYLQIIEYIYPMFYKTSSLYTYTYIPIYIFLLKILWP